MLGYRPDSATVIVLAWVALFIAIACSSAGNAFAKWASLQTGLWQKLGMLIAIGTFCFGFMFYALALAGLPLGLAYPLLVGGSVVCVALIGVLILRERVSVRLIIGVALILIGLIALHSGDRENAPSQQTARSPSAANHSETQQLQLKGAD